MGLAPPCPIGGCLLVRQLTPQEKMIIMDALFSLGASCDFYCIRSYFAFEESAIQRLTNRSISLPTGQHPTQLLQIRQKKTQKTQLLNQSAKTQKIPLVAGTIESTETTKR